MSRYQIRDGDVGVAMYEGETARDALIAYLTDRLRCEAADLVVERADGEAEAEFRGTRYETKQSVVSMADL